MDYRLIEASEAAHYLAASALFTEYAASLDFDLCFQNIEHELTILPIMYGPPAGQLLLVETEGQYTGCAGLRRLGDAAAATCELKRMYLRPACRGAGIGRALMQKLLQTARALGYTTMKLDTIGYKMPEAVRLYRTMGFEETAPYTYNPHEGVLYFALKL